MFPFDKTVHWPQEIAGRRMDIYHRWMEVVVPGSMLGCPIMGLPVGFNAAGLPMGMQLIGRHRADLDVLRLANAYDQATAWPRRRPPPGHLVIPSAARNLQTAADRDSSRRSE